MSRQFLFALLQIGIAFLKLSAQADSGVSVMSLEERRGTRMPLFRGAVTRALDGEPVAKFKLQWRCGSGGGEAEFLDGEYALKGLWPSECDLSFSAPLLKSFTLHAKAEPAVMFDIKLEGLRAIHGRVFSGTLGLPGRGVALSLDLADKANALSVLSDETGAFSFSGVIPGRYVIKSAGATLPATPAAVTVAENQDPAPLTLTVPESGRVTVEFSPSQEPLKGFFTTLSMTDRSGRNGTLHRGYESGRVYASEAVAPGEYWLEYDRPVSRIIPVYISAGIMEKLTVDLTPTPFHGRVILHGRPLSNRDFALYHLPRGGMTPVELAAKGWRYKRYGLPGDPLKTDTEGKFFLADLAPGAYVLMAESLWCEFEASQNAKGETVICFP